MKLYTRAINKSYKGRQVVKDVSIEVNQGEIVGLLGPNGAGKTTSFYMIVGLVKPDSGNVFLEDKDITKLPMFKRSQMGMFPNSFVISGNSIVSNCRSEIVPQTDFPDATSRHFNFLINGILSKIKPSKW